MGEPFGAQKQLFEPFQEGLAAFRAVEVAGECPHCATVQVGVATGVAARCEQLYGASGCPAQLVLVERDRPTREQCERNLGLIGLAACEASLEIGEKRALGGGHAATVSERGRALERCASGSPPGGRGLCCHRCLPGLRWAGSVSRSWEIHVTFGIGSRV
jgi:hypothetical protein